MKWSEEKQKLAKELIILLYDSGAIKTWYRDRPSGWTLVSGLWSPLYIQLRSICSYRDAGFLLRRIGFSVWRMMQEEASDVNKLLGIAFTGIPIAVATTTVSGVPSCHTRKVSGIKLLRDLEREILKYGEHALVEGELEDGDVIALVDDLVTKFDSKLLAMAKLKHEIKRRNLSSAIRCNDVIVLIDREQGAKERATELGVNLHSLIPFKSKGIEWLKDNITSEEYEVINDYLKDPTIFQNDEVHLRLKRIAQEASIQNQDANRKP